MERAPGLRYGYRAHQVSFFLGGGFVTGDSGQVVRAVVSAFRSIFDYEFVFCEEIQLASEVPAHVFLFEGITKCLVICDQDELVR